MSEEPVAGGYLDFRIRIIIVGIILLFFIIQIIIRCLNI